jgi:hypothetical protein
MGGFSARELSMLIVSLARLEYKPSSAWLDAFAAAAAAKMGSFQAQVRYDALLVLLLLLLLRRRRPVMSAQHAHARLGQSADR